MPDVHYENRRLAEIYDLDSPWSEDRDFYLALADGPPKKILDLGCGTGLICNAYAEKGHDVTGVDPSQAMLDVARRKPCGKKIEWVQARAQDFKSDKRFDLVIMTGHAFQVLLDDADILVTFATIRDHMSSAGQVVFESRNPALNWERRWNYDWEIALPDGVLRESRRFVEMKNDCMIFELHYKFPEETFVSASELRFPASGEIEKFMAQSGLRVEKILGDWRGGPFKERISEEMIFTGRLL